MDAYEGDRHRSTSSLFQWPKAGSPSAVGSGRGEPSGCGVSRKRSPETRATSTQTRKGPGAHGEAEVSSAEEAELPTGECNPHGPAEQLR